MLGNKFSLPKYELKELKEKLSKYLLCIPVINEGEKFISQMKEIKQKGINNLIDIAICDGGSSDGSTDEKLLKELGVTVVITKKSEGKLSDQLMLGYAYALEKGYEGTVTMDGNGKDGIDAIKDFMYKLEQGYDFIQGSRYLKGGQAINTPKSREVAIKLIHVPIINHLSGFKYTDTTNGFRGHSIRVFKDERISPFRYGEFPTYSLIHYLTVIVPQLGYKVTEIPVIRKYPDKGNVPTKISPIKGNIDLMKILYNLSIKKYNPSIKDC
jgi:dolichol-phosphate mannosyltransferase